MNKSLWTQSQKLGGFSSYCPNPKMKNLMWASELSVLWENYCSISIFQFWVSLLVDIGFNFIVIASLLPTCYSFLSLDVGFLFVVGFSILLSMVVQQLFAIWVLSQEEMSTSPSTLPFSKIFYFLYIICVKSIINLLHTVLHS